jgi:nitric oxide synthase-interacting protein
MPGRKSKTTGSGHLPLSSHERIVLSKEYGTQGQRLSSVSQYKFGHCALSLAPAKDQPVATPSGFIYERSAMLEYLLTKTQESKQQQQDYERRQAKQQEQKEADNHRKREATVEDFQDSQTRVVAKKQKIEKHNPLSKSSYWLAEFQPKKLEEADISPPPKRPPSPNSQQPLRLKDLVSLELKRNKEDQVVCAISEKNIVAQSAVCLVTKSGKPAHVVLEQVYKDVVGKERTCPITGSKITQVLNLQKGGSSFASSGGKVEAKTYRPTMT